MSQSIRTVTNKIFELQCHCEAPTFETATCTPCLRKQTCRCRYVLRIPMLSFTDNVNIKYLNICRIGQYALFDNVKLLYIRVF